MTEDRSDSHAGAPGADPDSACQPADAPPDDTLAAPAAPVDALEAALSGALAAPEGAAPIGFTGRVIGGRYRLEQRLGAGGMGEVFAATHLETGGQVAVKLLHGAGALRPQLRQRLRLEARNAAALQHANTVRVIDFGEAEGGLFLVMERLEGRPLDALIEAEGALDWPRVAAMAAQVLGALDEAHSHPRRIVHRDIKPSNLFLCRRPGQGEQIKVLDFGISRALEGTGADTQGVLGSPHTMAPEQWRGEAVDGRADLYGLGCTVYQLLSGRPVFEVSSALGQGHHHIHEPPPLEALPSSLPGAARRWLSRMLAKSPDDRYPSAAEALAALDEARGEAGAAPAPGAGRAPLPRFRGTLGALGALVVALIGGSLLWLQTLGNTDSGDDPRAGAAVASPANPTPTQTALPSPAPTSPDPTRAPLEPALPAAAFTPCEAPAAACPNAAQRPWCDAAGAQVACCGPGLVPVDRDGVCGCPPHGARGPAALAAGCRPATADDDRAMIQAHMRALRPTVQACYAASLEADPRWRPEGTIHMGFAIGDDGAVREASISGSSLPDVEVQRCVLQALRAHRFAPPVDGLLKVNYPFRFEND